MTILLSPGLKYGCVSPSILRNAASNLLKIESANIEDLCLCLGCDIETCRPVWEGMIQDNWIVRRNEKWVPSENIRQLAHARIGSPCPRKKAAALIEKAIENAIAINSMPETEPKLYWVTKIAVFGSYLNDKQELGDIDIAFELKSRLNTRQWAMHCLMYGKDQFSATRGKLRPKSPYVQLNWLSTVVENEFPYKIVYEFSPPITPSIPDC